MEHTLGDIYRGPYGDQFHGTMLDLFNPDAWKKQYMIGRDMLGLDRATAGQRLGQEMAGQGMYRQGPMSQGLKGLEGEYMRALTQLLGQTQQSGLANRQAMLQQLLGLATRGKEMDLFQKQMQKSWLSSLFGGIGSMVGAGVPFLGGLFGGGGGGGGGGSGGGGVWV
jgi:hypothetical protein